MVPECRKPDEYFPVEVCDCSHGEQDFVEPFVQELRDDIGDTEGLGVIFFEAEMVIIELDEARSLAEMLYERRGVVGIAERSVYDPFGEGRLDLPASAEHGFHLMIAHGAQRDGVLKDPAEARELGDSGCFWGNGQLFVVVCEQDVKGGGAERILDAVEEMIDRDAASLDVVDDERGGGWDGMKQPDDRVDDLVPGRRHIIWGI